MNKTVADQPDQLSAQARGLLKKRQQDPPPTQTESEKQTDAIAIPKLTTSKGESSKKLPPLPSNSTNSITSVEPVSKTPEEPQLAQIDGITDVQVLQSKLKDALRTIEAKNFEIDSLMQKLKHLETTAIDSKTASALKSVVPRSQELAPISKEKKDDEDEKEVSLLHNEIERLRKRVEELEERLGQETAKSPSSGNLLQENFGSIENVSNLTHPNKDRPMRRLKKEPSREDDSNSKPESTALASTSQNNSQQFSQSQTSLSDALKIEEEKKSEPQPSTQPEEPQKKKFMGGFNLMGGVKLMGGVDLSKIKLKNTGGAPVATTNPAAVPAAPVVADEQEHEKEKPRISSPSTNTSGGLSRQRSFRHPGQDNIVTDKEEVDEVRAFLKKILPQNRELQGDGDLKDILKSGVVLCNLMNTISPKACLKIRTQRFPVMQMENITMYLKACDVYGQGKCTIFDVPDLYEGTNISKVYTNILGIKKLYEESLK